MAVHAAAVEDPLIGEISIGEVSPDEEIVGVPESTRLGVALVAEKRRRRDEKLLVVRPVRAMAIETALDHRGVLPEEGSALLGVALVTQLIAGIAAQQRIRGRPVRLVAVAAGDFAFEQRHVGTLSELHALRGVAGEAGL